MRDSGAFTELLLTRLKKLEVPKIYVSLRKRLMENKPARYAWAGRPFAAAFAAAEERIRKMEYRYVSMLMHCPWRRAAELDRG